MSAPADQKTPQVHRLTDMITEEVSLVDRAANARKFLIFKRDQMAIGSEVSPAGDGTYTAGAGGASAPTGGASTAKAGASLLADQKDALSKSIADALALLTDAQSYVDGATVTEDPAAVSADDLVQSMVDAAGLLEDTLAALMGVEESDEDEMSEEAEPPPGDASEAMPPGPGPAGEGPSMPMGKRLAVITAKRVVSTAKGEKLGATMIAKYGARMSKKRLAQFKQAASIIHSLLGELDASAASTIKAAIAGKKQKGAPPAEAPAPTQKRDDNERAALEKAANDALALAAKFAQENRAIRGAVQKSNAAPPPSGAAANPDGGVLWPADMNAIPR